MTCDRCDGETTIRCTSRFNTESLCMSCLVLEERHPAYSQAVRAEARAKERGDYHFLGIGLPQGFRAWAENQRRGGAS